MSALNKDNICLTAAKVFVAPLGTAIDELLADGSNSEVVAAQCKALLTDPKTIRMASVLDTKLTIGKGKVIKVDADDTGTILNANTPEVKIGGTFFESKNIDAIATFLKVFVTDIAPTTSLGVASAFSGQVAGMTTDVVITANTAGIVGNNIKLEFNGIITVAAAIAALNLAHATNECTLTS